MTDTTALGMEDEEATGCEQGAGTAVTTLDVALEPGNRKRREAHETRDGKGLPGRAQIVPSTVSNSPASEGGGGRRERGRETRTVFRGCQPGMETSGRNTGVRVLPA